MTFKPVVKRINHLGIVSKNLAQSKNFFQLLLGLASEGSQDVLDQKTKTHFFSFNPQTKKDDPPRLEFLEGLGDGNPIDAFRLKKGSGVHHLAFEVEEIEKVLGFLEQNGITLIDRVPRIGAHQCKIAFIHPNSTGGILVELTEVFS